MGRNVFSLLAREKVTSLDGRRVPRRTSRGGRREGDRLPAGGAPEAHTSPCCSDWRAGRTPEAVIKNVALGLPTRPPTCPAIRHTKVGETSLWMMSPKDRAFSQAGFLFRVPTGTELRRASSHLTSGNRDPGAAGSGLSHRAFPAAHPMDRDSQASGVRGSWPTTQSWTKSRTVGWG